MSKSAVILIIIIAVLLIFGGIYWWQKSKTILQRACTQEAKLCPDGSYVGRTGPNCEFTPCLEAKDETANWQIYRNEEYGFEVKYPKDWIKREASSEELKYGKVVFLRSPGTEEWLKKGGLMIYEDLEILFRDNINDLGDSRSYPGQRSYSGLDDFLTDEKVIIQKIGEINIDNYKAYEVIIGGAGANYGIMIERDGIYQLLFGLTDIEHNYRPINDIEKKILSTFKFIK